MEAAFFTGGFLRPELACQSPGEREQGLSDPGPLTPIPHPPAQAELAAVVVTVAPKRIKKHEPLLALLCGTEGPFSFLF